jgi:hypothetical protein
LSIGNTTIDVSLTLAPTTCIADSI